MHTAGSYYLNENEWIYSVSMTNNFSSEMCQLTNVLTMQRPRPVPPCLKIVSTQLNTTKALLRNPVLITGANFYRKK